MTKRLIVILGDQLSHDISSLREVDPESDRIFLAEVENEAASVRHHKQKIIMVLSAMRHFASELAERGFHVDYVRLDDIDNTGTLVDEIDREAKRCHPASIVLTEPSEWRVLQKITTWAEGYGIPVVMKPDDRFLCSLTEFSDWSKNRKTLRMEHFYRWMRRRTGWLMAGDKPVGGRWNYDAENRKPWPSDRQAIQRERFPPDEVTQDVISLVRRRFSDHFGEVDGFGWPVTRRKALVALDHFIRYALPYFGDFQDAMVQGQPFLYHALLSPALNIGLLTPEEVGKRVLEAYQNGDAPLTSVEGFIRQILGWREYIRGIYGTWMPDYAKSNVLGATRPLPSFYWTGNTEMKCIAETILNIQENAYAHHIQRLMVTGNFALLAGIDPVEVEEWYLIVFADAFEWVELPNTHGMALFADGGELATKPYAASGAYIHRMSDYCGSCSFNPGIKNGRKACPFNPLYWNFMIENRAILEKLPRMGMAYRNLDRMDSERIRLIRDDARRILDKFVPDR